MNTPSMTRVKTPDDIPEGPHFAVLVYKTDSQHIPGDERSRTNPGHGYPAHTVTSTTYEHWVTCDEEALQGKVAALKERPKHSYTWKEPVFAVLKVERKLTVTTTTTVGIG
jgi:hypothetical protein